VKITLTFPQRRVTAFVVGNVIDRQGDIHNLQVMARRQRINDVLDIDELDEHFEQLEEERLANMSARNKAIAEGGSVPSVIDQSETRIGLSRDFRFRSGDVSFLRARMKDPKMQYYGLLPMEVLSTATAWGVDIDDEEDTALDDEEFFEEGEVLSIGEKEN